MLTGGGAHGQGDEAQGRRQKAQRNLRPNRGRNIMADNTPLTIESTALYAIETALGRAMTQAKNDLNANESIRIMRATEALRVVGPVCVGHTLTEGGDKFV